MTMTCVCYCGVCGVCMCVYVFVLGLLCLLNARDFIDF